MALIGVGAVVQDDDVAVTGALTPFATVRNGEDELPEFQSPRASASTSLLIRKFSVDGKPAYLSLVLLLERNLASVGNQPRAGHSIRKCLITL